MFGAVAIKQRECCATTPRAERQLHEDGDFAVSVSLLMPQFDLLFSPFKETRQVEALLDKH